MRPRFVIIEEAISKQGDKKLSVLKFFKETEDYKLVQLDEKRALLKTKDDYNKEVLGVLRLNNYITKDQYDMIRYNLINQFHECISIDCKHSLELEYGYNFSCSIYLSNRMIGGHMHEQTNATNYTKIV